MTFEALDSFFVAFTLLTAASDTLQKISGYKFEVEVIIATLRFKTSSQVLSR